MKVPLGIRPGDWLAVNTGNSLGNRAIRFGQAMVDVLNWNRGDPDPMYSRANHVIQVSHYEGNILWGVEGRPGGVGYVDLTHREWPYLSSDVWLEKTDDQRDRLVEWARTVAFGTRYDYSAIQYETLEALGIPAMWQQNWKGEGVPGQVICSTAWVYQREKLGVAVPVLGPGRPATPLDVDRFNQAKVG